MTKSNLKIIAAAIEVLNKDPSTRIDAIAEVAGVSRRTLHRHFSTREDLLKACAAWIMDKILNDVQSATQTHQEPLTQLRQMFDDDLAKGQYFEFCQKFMSYFENATIQRKFNEMGQLFRSTLDQAKAAGLIDPGLSNDWLEYIWMGIVRGANQALAEGAVAPKAVNDLAWRAFAYGMIKG